MATLENGARSSESANLINATTYKKMCMDIQKPHKRNFS